MGIGASSAAGLENPFPIEPAMERDLLRLSYVASRLLNKPDLYDLNNLARPGACGDYAVFLKEKLEKRLLPFVADICGETLSVVYQNPLKSFESVERRRQVCQDLANTMVRLVSIVIACLASLQFESPRVREAAGVPVTHSAPVQRGGGQDPNVVINWLKKNKYVSDTFNEYNPTIFEERIVVPLKDPDYSGSTTVMDPSIPQFTLYLNRVASADGSFSGYIVASGGEPQLPQNAYLKIIFLDPITVSYSPLMQVLPIQVLDGTGLSWMCGVMCGAMYKHAYLSLARPQTQEQEIQNPLLILYAIFRKAQPEIPADPRLASIIESPRTLAEAEYIFKNARENQSQRSEIILSRISSFLSAIGIRVPSTTPSAPGGLGYRPPLLTSAAPTALREIGYPKYMAPTVPGAGVRPGELIAGEYVIPPPAAKTILTTFRKYAGEIGAANNPAQIRATLLAGEVLRDRSIQTRICQDPYWNAPSLAAVYPWAALQFLCITNLREMGSMSAATPQATTPIMPVIPTPVGGSGTAAMPAPPAPVIRPSGPARIRLSNEWKRFIEELHKIYSGVEGLPNLTSTSAAATAARPAPPTATTTPLLEEQRFLNLIKTKGCAIPGRSPRVRFQEIQNGVLRLQGLYEEHAKEVWKILNSLIYVIEDPDSKAELIRLNPRIFSDGGSTSAFVEAKAVEARNLLINYYLEIEKTYTETIRNMRIVA